MAWRGAELLANSQSSGPAAPLTRCLNSTPAPKTPEYQPISVLKLVNFPFVSQRIAAGSAVRSNSMTQRLRFLFVLLNAIVAV